MALPSGFRERLEHMEETRNQRLYLLQAEKDLQTNKSLLLTAKRSNIRCMEQRCLMMEQKRAELSCKILAQKSEIKRFESEYQIIAQKFRDLKSEVEELEECEKNKDRFYEMKSAEMREFQGKVKECVLESRLQVQEMRFSKDKLKLSLKELQGNSGYLSNSEIAAAETVRVELLSVKENLERNLASNYQLGAQLEKQLQKALIS